MDREQLAQLKRAELQKLSKDEGLKANLKTEALLDALEAHYASNPTRRPSQPLRAATNTPLPPSDEPTNTTAASENPKPRRTTSRTTSRSQAAKQAAAPSQAAKQAAAPSQSHSQSQTQAAAPTSQAALPTHAEEDMQNAPQPQPRTRKAKETQLRLGVGRPKLIGGTGARATNPKPVAAPVRASRRKTPAVEQQLQQQGVQDAPTASVSVSISPPEEAGRENQSQRTAPNSNSNLLALETIREHASGEGAEGQEMPAVPIVPIDVTPALSAASSSNSNSNTNSVSHGSPVSVASSTTPHATDARVATLESRVGVLEAQNAMLLARVAALEERATGRLASTTVGGPSSPALSIPQSARIRSDTSSLVPRSARVRSDASQQSMASVASLSRPASARRVSGMPSPRRTSLAVQPSASWMTGAATTIVEEDEGSSTASGGIPVPMEVAIAMQQQQPSPPMQFSPPATSTTGMQAPQQSMQQHSPYDPMQNMGLPPNMQFNPAPPPPQLHYPNLTQYAPSPPQQLPLWASALPPHVVPTAAGPSALGKHARDSAPTSPAMPSSESTPTTRPPPRKKPRLESTLGHGVPPHMRRMQQQQHPQEVDLDPEPLVSINKSFGGAAAPKTPPRAGPVQVPVPETPLTAAYGATLAALFRGPREEDIPEEERSPEKKTLYGTERSNDTRFGEFGWGWR